MKLALKRGVSHDEFLRTTSTREVAEYEALNLIDPLFDGQRIEIGLATLSSLTHNLLKHPDTPATTADEWLPKYEKRFDGPTQTEDEISDEFDAWYAEQVRKGLIQGE